MKIRFGSRSIALPANPVLRIGLGVLLVFFGCLGFLPILGFWMVPLGLVILSADFPAIRRRRRKATVAIMRWWHGSPRAALLRRLWHRLTGRRAPEAP